MYVKTNNMLQTTYCCCTTCTPAICIRYEDKQHATNYTLLLSNMHPLYTYDVYRGVNTTTCSLI